MPRGTIEFDLNEPRETRLLELSLKATSLKSVIEEVYNALNRIEDELPDFALEVVMKIRNELSASCKEAGVEEFVWEDI